MSGSVHEASVDELASWDRQTVDAPGGHVYQSRAWAEHRAAQGWRARHMVLSNGAEVLALERAWPLVGGASAYLPRGPVPDEAGPDRTAAHLVEAADWLAERGVDVVASDAEVPATTGYPATIRRAGFRPIGEIQPSRHRMSLPLPIGVTEDDVLAGTSKSTRQRIRAAERAGVAVVRYDACADVDPGSGFVAPASVTAAGPGRPSDTALDQFYTLLERVGDRRAFRFGPRSEFVAWWRRALAAGHLVYLEARGADAVLGGLILYRHGRRLSTVHSADRAGRPERGPRDDAPVALARDPAGRPRGARRDGPRRRGRRAGPSPAVRIRSDVRAVRAQALVRRRMDRDERRARACVPALALRSGSPGLGGTSPAGREAEDALVSDRTASQPDAVTDRIERALAAAEPTRPRPLEGLLERLERLELVSSARRDGRAIGPVGLADVAAHGVTEDSRQVAGGRLFVAIAGEHVDGHEFVAAAAAAGAAAALVERPVPDVALPQLVLRNARRGLAEAAAWWYRDASRELGVLGVTGTDGKTTTSLLAVAALEAAGISSGLVGTVARRIGRDQDANPEHVTTPSAPWLQRALRAMVGAGNRCAVVETTSHGLALDRVAGIAYDVAILTNLTHEHLELHGTYEAYRAAKLSLFERLAARDPAPGSKTIGWPRAGVVNADDPSAALFEAVTLEAGARCLTYGTDPRADVRATRIEEDSRRLRVAYEAPSGAARLELQLAGRFNAHNALAVVALGEVLGLEPAAVRAGLEGVSGVPGRMERIDAGQPFGVIVDYAHSPASLGTVLDLLVPIAAARGGGVVVVFGSAGERDVAKRPMMGRIAAERSRLVVVTDEDPRGEDREAILDDIARGAEATGRRRERDLLVIPDRRTAIEAAFERARPGDVVLLAGKGHERTILYDSGPLPWDEAAVARDVLGAMGYGWPADKAGREARG